MPRRRLRALTPDLLSLFRSWSRTLTSPWSAFSSLVRSRIRVVLPLPDLPVTKTNSPAFIFRETPPRAGTGSSLPYFL